MYFRLKSMKVAGKSRMTEITFSISEKLQKKMKAYPEIEWGRIAQGAIEKYLEELEFAESILGRSKLTTNEAEAIGNNIKRKVWQQHKKVLDAINE